VRKNDLNSRHRQFSDLSYSSITHCAVAEWAYRRYRTAQFSQYVVPIMTKCSFTTILIKQSSDG